MEKRLDKNVTIITGGGKGIGFGIAKAFAKEGSNLVITGRTESRLIAAKERLEEEYGIIKSCFDNTNVTSFDVFKF